MAESVEVFPEESFVLLQEKPNPSTEYYVEPLLSSNQSSYQVFNLYDSPSKVKLDVGDRLSIIIIRYLNPEWKQWIHMNNNKLHRVIYFMDDDLFDLRPYTRLSLFYLLKWYRFAYRFKSWIKKRAELWVSTGFLADKYSAYSPKLLQPKLIEQSYSQPITVFYHGSPVHIEEYRWLYPVMREVLQQNANICLEIFGSAEIKKMYSSLPRVNVIHSMDWPSYKCFLNRSSRDIGLAPLLALPSNSARASTRFFDITQSSSVGIYSDHPAYRSIVRHDVNGLILPMDKALWVQGILELASDESYRQRLFNSAKQSIRDL